MIRSLFAAAALFSAVPAFAQLLQDSPPKAATEAPPVMIMGSNTSQPSPVAENVMHLDLSTGGRVSIVLRPDMAPAHVDRIKGLVKQGFYNGLLFHRVIEGFMAQTGDPKGTGQGGSELPDLKAEFNELPHVRGAVSMARTDEPDSANSQFFIVLQPVLRLDRQYTVFGRVFAGMQWVDRIERGEPPANPSRILQASMASDNKPAPAFPAAAAPVDPLAAEAAKLLKSVSPKP